MVHVYILLAYPRSSFYFYGSNDDGDSCDGINNY